MADQIAGSAFLEQTAGSTLRDTINLKDVWLELRRHSGDILKFTGVLLVLAVLFIVFSTPTFLSAGSFYTNAIKPAGVANSNDLAGTTASTYPNYLSTFGAVADVQTQTDIISSPSLVQGAVLITGLNTKLTGPGLSTPSYLIWKLFYGGSISVYSPEQIKLTVAFADFSNPAVRARRYHVVFQEGGHYEVRLHGDVVLKGVLNQPASGGGLSLLLQFHDQSVLPASGSVYRLVVTAPAITAAGILKKGLAVTPGGSATSPSELINLTFVSSNPYQAQAFINALMSEYIDKTVSWNSESASQTEDFITSQLNDVQRKLVVADKKLATYQQRTGVISPPDNATDAINQEAALDSQRVELEIRVNGLQQLLSSLDKPSGVVNPYLISQDQGTPISLLSGAMAQDLATLKNLETRFTVDNPQVVSILAQIEQERIGIRSMVKNELAAERANLDAVNAQVATYQNQLGAMPTQALEVTELTNSSTVLGQLYVLLMQKQQEAAISKAAAVSSTQIVMPAQLPWKSASPKPTSILPLVLVLGLLGGSGWVLLKGGLEGRFNSAREAREFVKTGLFVAVPAEKPQQPYLAKVEFEQALYTLRINLLHAFPDNLSKVILVTAASSAEQKSMIAYSLAKVLAAGEKKVALVDADFHTGRLRSFLEVTSSTGLLNWLARGEPVVLQNFKNENISFLPAGIDPDMGAKPLNDVRLSSVLSDLRSEYDFVVLDGPTPPRIADILTLAAWADAILSVLETTVSVRQSVAALQSVILPIDALLGVIVLERAI